MAQDLNANGHGISSVSVLTVDNSGTEANFQGAYVQLSIGDGFQGGVYLNTGINGTNGTGVIESVVAQNNFTVIKGGFVTVTNNGNAVTLSDGNVTASGSVGTVKIAKFNVLGSGANCAVEISTNAPNDIVGVHSIDFNANFDSALTINEQDVFLLTAGEIYDGSGNPSIEAGGLGFTRQLYGIGGDQDLSANWNDRILYSCFDQGSTAPVASIHWNYRKLLDYAGNPVLCWSNSLVGNASGLTNLSTSADTWNQIFANDISGDFSKLGGYNSAGENGSALLSDIGLDSFGGKVTTAQLPPGVSLSYTGVTNIGGTVTSLLIRIGHDMGTTNYVPSVSYIGGALATVVFPTYSGITTTNFTLNLTGTGFATSEKLTWSTTYSP